MSAALGRAVFTGKFALAGESIHPIDPLILSQTRTSFSLLVLLPMLVGRSGWQRIKLPTRDLIQCLILGMLGVAASNYFYYVAIQRTSVAIAIILQYTAPVWVLLYVVARGQQKLSVQKVVAVLVAVAGIALTIGVVGGRSTSPMICPGPQNDVTEHVRVCPMDAVKIAYTDVGRPEVDRYVLEFVKNEHRENC